MTASQRVVDRLLDEGLLRCESVKSFGKTVKFEVEPMYTRAI